MIGLWLLSATDIMGAHWFRRRRVAVSFMPGWAGLVKKPNLEDANASSLVARAKAAVVDFFTPAGAEMACAA